MTKTYAITEEQKDAVCKFLSDSGSEGANNYEEVIESLPLITGEPVAWTWDTAGTGGMMKGYYEAHFQFAKPEKSATMLNLSPLYTHPKPLQPITADDITAVMHQEFNNYFVKDGEFTCPKDSEIMAACANIWIKHKGDTK